MIVTSLTMAARREISLDAGYAKYMAYLEELGPIQPKFGTRDQTKRDFSIYMSMSADLVADDSVDMAIKALGDKVLAETLRICRQEVPEAFTPADELIDEAQLKTTLLPPDLKDF